jgi:hypothetical protein
VETAVKRKSGAFIIEDQVRVIQARDWLTLKAAALLLNVSPLMLSRWVLAGKLILRFDIQSEKLLARLIK